MLVRCCQPLRQLHSDFGDFSEGVRHAMKITTADSNPDVGLSTQQMFCFSPAVVVRANKVSILTRSTALDRGLFRVSKKLLHVWSLIVVSSVFAQFGILSSPTVSALITFSHRWTSLMWPSSLPTV